MHLGTQELIRFWGQEIKGQGHVFHHHHHHHHHREVLPGLSNMPLSCSCQVYEDYAEQADNWLSSKEAFLANDDVGVSDFYCGDLKSISVLSGVHCGP